jgi:uracil phosphoribosyltransferase
LLRELTFFLGYEATEDVELRDLTVQTPVAQFEGKEVSTRVTLIPIMRAGLGMVDAMQDIIPEAHVHHIGMFRRGASSLLPVVYFNKVSVLCPWCNLTCGCCA